MVNNVIGCVRFNFLLIFFGGCGMYVKITRFRCGLNVDCVFFAISRLTQTDQNHVYEGNFPTQNLSSLIKQECRKRSQNNNTTTN